MKDVERRTGPRVPVEIYLDQFVEDEPHAGFVTSLSTRGLYLEQVGDPQARVGDRVQLELPLPDGSHDPLWALGEIVYERPEGLFRGSGIRFEVMGDFHRDRLVQWVRRRAAALSPYLPFPTRLTPGRAI